MNNIRNIEKITAEELRLGIYGGLSKGSWHDEYKESAWVYLGGFAYELTEGDLICVMSQWGEVEDIHLVREKETGKSKGFSFVKFEDQRSTILAVDNLNGAKLLGRTLRCDHVSQYKLPKDVRDREGEAFQADPSSRIEIGPGHAYKGKELANEYDINEGVDLWNKKAPAASSKAVPPPSSDTESEDEERRPAAAASKKSRQYSSDSETDDRREDRNKHSSSGRRSSSRREDSQSRSKSPARRHQREDNRSDERHSDRRSDRHDNRDRDRDSRKRRERSRTPPRKRRHGDEDDNDNNRDSHRRHRSRSRDQDNRKRDRDSRSRDRHDRPQTNNSSSNRSSGGEKVLEELASAMLSSRTAPTTTSSSSSGRPLSLQPTPGAPVASWRGRRDPELRKAVEDVKRVIERTQGNSNNSDIPEKRRDELSGIGGVRRIR